ncbi:MAG: COG4315 family predicted lipoprotein [Mycobacteriales bacterium]
MTSTRWLRPVRIGVPLLALAAFTAACGSSSSGQSQNPASAIAPAGSGGASIQLSNGHLADGSGRTVYLWVADSAGSSHCSGACASVWPPVTVSGQPTPGQGVTASQLTTTKRSDGKTQLVYAGHPLYYYASDSAPGDANGQGSDGFGAKWWELDGSGHAITGAATAPTSAGSSSAGSGGGAYGY